jgi:Domain of unknown function (DUF4421)
MRFFITPLNRSKEWLRQLVPVFLSTVLLFNLAQAQEAINRDHDTTYYSSYRQKLTVRTYLSKKYTSIRFTPAADESIPVITYRPNTSLNIGLGATYRGITLDIGFGLTTFNPNQERGTTKYLDLQTHFYTRKWNVDLLGEFYRGYYLTPKGIGLSQTESESYYVRNDLALDLVGGSAYRALNNRQFSYQAALLQNEWQKKSAGSILVGGQAFYGAILADSTLVPSLVDSTYAGLGIRKVHFVEIGPGFGYAYCLVFYRNFYMMASATVNFDFRFSSEIEPAHVANKIDLSPNFILYAGIGYNSEKWNISAKWLANEIFVRGAASGYRYTIAAGSYRLIYARRFSLTHEVKKVLNPIDNFISPP